MELASLSILVIALAILGLILQKFREERPSWLLNFETFSEKLQGYWTPLFIVVAPFAFLYNVGCTAVYAVITLLELLIKVLQWLYYWLWTRAFLWFWRNVIVIPIVLLAKLIWHYLFKWPWRIYYQAYHTIWKSITRKTVKIGWQSATIAIFIAGLFKLLSIAFDLAVLEQLGFVLCLIPITFGLGTVASMRSENDLNGDSMSIHKSRGIASATRALKYILIALGIVLIVSAISMTGTFNQMGVVLLGLTINISHLLGIIGVGIMFVLAIMVSILPGYSITNPKTNFRKETVDLILLGRDKILQYALASVFALVFAGLIAIIPAFIVGAAFKGTTLIKEKILTKSSISQKTDLEDIEKALATDTLDNDQWTVKMHEKVTKHQVLSQIEYLSAFPMNIIKNPDNCLHVDTLFWINNDLASMTSEYENNKKQREQSIAELDIAISDLETAISTEREERSTYLVQRSTDDGESWTNIGEDITVSGYKDSNLDLNTAYRYRVIASNKAGTSRKSNEANAMTKDLKITTPSSFRATAESNFRVVLDWNDNSWNESGFLIERSNDKDDWSTVVSLGKNITRYIDSDISDTTYYYRLRAFSTSDSSSSVLSNSVRPTLAAPYVRPKKMTHDGILIEWTHKDEYIAHKSTGKVTENTAPTIDFAGMSTLDILLGKVKDLQLKQEDLRAQQAKEDEKINPRLALLNELQDTTNTSVTIKYIGYILGLLAIAALAGLVVAFVLAYLGSLLWAIHQLTDGESYFFVKEIKEIRMQSPNQPLLGFLLLGLILSLTCMAGAGCTTSIMGKISLPDVIEYKITISDVDEYKITSSDVDESEVVEVADTTTIK